MGRDRRAERSLSAGAVPACNALDERGTQKAERSFAAETISFA